MEKNELPCGAILAIFGVGVFLTIFLVNYPDESSGAWAAWAAWVQAFGSIGAIMAAYFLGERQSARSEKLQLGLAEQQIKQKRAAIYAIAQSALDLATHVGGIFTPKGNWDEVPDYQYNDAMIDAQMTALNAVPVHEIGSATAVREFLSLNQKLWELQHLANHWKETRRSENLSETAKEDLCFEAHELMKFVIEELDVKVKRIHAAMYPDADAVAREGAPT